jgi:hypothetical protein
MFRLLTKPSSGVYVTKTAYTGHTQKNGGVNTQITTTPHHSFVYTLYIQTSIHWFTFLSTILSPSHKYKVTVHINNSEGDKIVLKKVNQWIDACIYICSFSDIKPWRWLSEEPKHMSGFF